MYRYNEMSGLKNEQNTEDLPPFGKKGGRFVLGKYRDILSDTSWLLCFARTPPSLPPTNNYNTTFN